MYDEDSFTFGSELELADIDINLGSKLPNGCGWDRRDVTMVNSNGIAVDPKGISWKKGGEINTAPTSTIDQQVNEFCEIINIFPEINVNYRSNLHIHIGVPGLDKDLQTLKSLQVYILEQLPQVLSLIEPIPKPTIDMYPDNEEFLGAMKRYRRRRRSHQTILPINRVKSQLKAKTLKRFFEEEVPKSQDGRPLWHLQPRAAINIRQLLETKTIEFRHFPGTLDPEEFATSLMWCKIFLSSALRNKPIIPVWYNVRKKLKFPKFEPYIHKLERRYKMTCHDGSIPREEIERNIKKILTLDKLRVCHSQVGWLGLLW